MSKKKKVNNKNKQSNKKTKPCNKKCDRVCSRNSETRSLLREKAYGEPTPIKPLRPVSEYYNLETNEIYPKIFFKEGLWTKFLRFLGLVS